MTNANETVTVDALVDAVWGPEAPDRAAQSLESLIWRLRKIIEPGRAARATATLLQTVELGYQLTLRRTHIDSYRLLEAHQRLPELLAANDNVQALELADAALSLWRGQPYFGVPEAQWMQPLRTQLEEARLELQQYHIQALLETGQPERAVSELLPLLADHPYRERLWGQRMLALYRCGRQSEALAAFAEARALLAEELGVDPGPDLRDLHRRILEQDRRLDLTVEGPPASRNVHLPSRRAVLIGRAQELKRLGGGLARTSLLTVTGPGGVGKTRLAVEAAYLARDQFGDGVWFVDLSEISDANLVWSRIALAIGLGLQPGSDIASMTLAFLRQRAVLLVLDNCEHVLDAVADAADVILEHAPQVKLLATSREPVELPGEKVFPVAPLEPPTDLAALAGNSAVQLFLDLLGDTGSNVDLEGPAGSSIARICAAVGGLPLGLELAAARARNFELAEVANALERSPTTLTRPGRGSARQLTLHDTIDWSYRLTRPDEQILHRRLSVIGGPFTTQAAEGLCGLAPLRKEQAMDLVGGLVHRSLLTPGATSRMGGPTLFAQLVPLRAHARSSLEACGELSAVEAARNDWVVAHMLDAPNDGRAGQAEWYEWVEDNYAVIDSALSATLLEAPSRAGLLLTEALTVYWYDRSLMIEGMHWLQAAKALPGLDAFDRARARASYGSARALNQETELAQADLAAAISELSEPRDENARVAGELLLRMGAASWTGDLWTDAVTATRQAKLIGERTENPDLVLRARAVLSACELIVEDPQRAVLDATSVLDDNREVGNHFAAFFACVTSGIAAVFNQDSAAGLYWSGEAMYHQRALGVRNIGDTLEQRGTHYTNTGQYEAATRCYGGAAAESEREGRSWPRHPGTPERLQRLREGLSPAAYQRNWESGQRLGRSEQHHAPEDWS